MYEFKGTMMYVVTSNLFHVPCISFSFPILILNIKVMCQVLTNNVTESPYLFQKCDTTSRYKLFMNKLL